MSFVGLHIHSDYSLLDGASQLPELVERVIELGMPAIALTDHGVMYGAIELIKVCRGKGVKPIIGNEMYVINGDIEKQERRPRYHQVVLAKNKQGYKNLVKLTTLSHLKGVQGKGIFSRPCINKDLLTQYREGLIVTSACLGGEIPQAILQKKPEIARRVAAWYKDLFGDDFYLEIQDHGSPEDRIVNVELIKIAQELDIKFIATNDSHFISCYDVEAHDALLCIQTGKLITEDKRLRYSGTEYLKSAQEMSHLFRDHLPDEVIEEAIARTLEVAEKVVDDYGILGEPRIPDYPIPKGYTAETYLQEVTRLGLQNRFQVSDYDEIKPVYQERLDYELKMMERMGFATYFLVVWDYIKYARDHGIPVGPGRGSAAGSLVAYALGITNIDPVHHGLLFERFLNPERKSMPDIDTDFCIERRDEVIRYVTEKYGEERVAQIITFNRMTSKAVLKDVARVLNIPYGDADRMAKLIPVVRGKPTKLKVMISDDTPAPEFKEKYDKDSAVRHWLDMAMRIEGTNKTFGMHAAGVVISAEPLDEVVPLQRNNDGSVITQYFMEDIESLGLLKMDFLGLRNLTMIQKTVDLIKQSRQLEIDLDRLALDDDASYKLLARGELEGIFQLESSGMRQIVRDLKPSNLEDISSILALYRPGPLDAGLIPLFIDRKHGRQKIEYQHELLEPILSETYAVLVYQEQIMRIAQDLAGYTLGEADILRRCLSGSTELVDVETGSLVSLNEIAGNPNYWLGRRVFSLNLKTQKIVEQPIAAIWPNGVKEVWEVQTKTNRRIRATKDHLFYTLLGWQPLERFKVGDRIGIAKTLPIRNASPISDSPIKWSTNLLDDRHQGSLSIALKTDELIAIADSEVFWDEIVSIELVGKEPVFDLTIPDTHNFIANDFVAHNCMGKKKPAEMQKQREMFLSGSERNGIKPKVAEELFDQMVKFAEYCFNKSHSTAYGYVTYQTAYLKANYPVEYMAALLTSNSGDQDKVQKYIASCMAMGIDVEPPDINRSGVDFTPLTKSILFGLSAVRNVGQGAIECLLESRATEGPFKSLAELCDRVDNRAVNRRALEALIQCGAFDCLEPNRNQLMQDLDLVLDWAQSRARDRASGQGSLFDLLGGGGTDQGSTSGFESAPKAPLVEDFPPQEKLRLEKELLGFYISDHPLKSVQQSARVLAPINLSELSDQREDATLSAIVLITGIKPVTTKKGDRMAILQLEDLTGHTEAVVFPKTYERIQSYLFPDARLMVWGKVDRRDEQVQLILDDAELIEDVRMVMVELEPKLASDIEQQHRLRTLLLENRGDEEKAKIPVVAIVSAEERRQFVRFGPQFRVHDYEAAVHALQAAGFHARASSLTGS